MPHPPAGAPADASFREDIPVDWILIRDTIRVNDALLQEIRAEITVRMLSPAATLAVVAREIVHDPGYVLTGLTGHPLVLVAEVYRGNGGAVDASGSTGPGGGQGPSGAPGQNHSGQQGGAGGRGGDGGPGNPASPVTVMAHQVSDLRIAARGGRGGPGGTGGTGGHGYNAARPPNKPDIDPPEPGPGGPGGNGGNGSVGGPAAWILVETTSHSGLALDGAGGEPGGAGPAGRGGRGGTVGGGGTPVGDSGPDGLPGVPGPGSGPSVQPALVVHGNDNWWALVRLRLGGHARSWSAHRTRVGEFLFRSYAPAVADRKGLREAASREFLRALDLDTGQERAAELSRWIATGLSPIGQPYNLDLMPDFPHFEQVVTDYDDIVKSLFDNALSLLLSSVDTGQKNARLTADLNRVADMQPVLRLEDDAARLDLEMSQGKAKIIDQQLGEVRAQLDAVREEMTQKRMEFPPGNDLGALIGAAVAVAAAVSAVYTGGASLVAFLAAAQLMANSVGALEGFDARTGEKQDAGKLVEWWDWEDPGNPRLKDDKKDDAGGLKELIDTGNQIIDAGRAVAELFQTTVDGKLESRERDLIARQLDLGRQRGLQILEVNQRNALKAVTAAKIVVNQRDLERLRNLQADWASDIAALGMISRTLIDRTQAYADVLIRFAFYAHRALDIFTVSGNKSAEFTFDLGHLHPDEVEHAHLALSRGEDSRVIPLLQSYLSSWSRMPQLLGLRGFYDQYQSGLQHASRFLTITSPAVLDGLRANGTATFALPLTDFPAEWSELKTEEVYVALLGARAAEPAVNVHIQHSGKSVNRMRGGALRETSGQPLSTTAEAVFVKRVPGATPAGRPAFWGRSPVTTWRVSVEKLSAEQNGLDLSGLTGLHFTLRYAFFAPPAAALPAVPPMTAGADFDGDGRPDSAVWDSAAGDWHIEPSSGAPARTVPFGRPGDIPVPGDWDGDGRAELAVYRPADRVLYSRPYEGGPTAVHLWRTEGYEPVPGDHPGMDRLANAFRIRAGELTGAGRHAEAVAVQQEARDGYAQLAAESDAYRSSLAQTLVMLGVYRTRAGLHEEAPAAAREGAELYRAIGDRPQEAWALGNLAWILTSAGRHADAVGAQEEATGLYRRLAGSDPAYRAALAQALVMLGTYATRAGRHDDAVAAAREGADVYRVIGDRPQWAWALGNAAAALTAAGRHGEAVDAQGQCVSVHRELAGADPAYRASLAMALVMLGVYGSRAARHEEAVAAAREGAEVYRAIGDRAQEAWALGNAAAALHVAGRTAEAADSQRAACDLYRELAAGTPAYRPPLAQTAHRLAQLLVGADRRPEALAAAREAVAVYEALHAGGGAYAAQLSEAVRLRDSLAGG
ncbi:tetratricopeptide repeat protein [Streptomyces sp. CAU 1734]|uniref:tetratricopeptide repeat protein n=1 Tax=Streptomyces sp. CAU 1734 TaxID=3140360 RepID=UPI003260333D